MNFDPYFSLVVLFFILFIRKIEKHETNTIF